MGHMTCVMFSPEDLELVKGAPQARRTFLDMLLSQSQAAYFYALQNYHGILRQRNALLKEIARGRGQAAQLDVWDEQLAKAAGPIVMKRRETAYIISSQAGTHYAYIAGRSQESFLLQYQGSLADSPEPEQALLQQLHAAREEDLRRLSTGPGPHRDDLRLLMGGQDMRSYASQGQARTAALAMRLAQIDILTAAHQETPLLLLDDVLSELDQGRQARLLASLDRMQTFLTCTELNDMASIHPSCVLTVKEGQVSE